MFLLYLSLLYFYIVEHCCPYFVEGDMQIWSIDWVIDTFRQYS